jgi:PIN domain nuclease of toxin-antitoxin system
VSSYVTDTHALIWHLTADAQLSTTCREVFEAADRGEATIWIPAIVLVETVYLAEKARFPSALVTQMLDLVDPPSAGYIVATLDAGVVRSLAAIDRSEVPDMPDRIIAATALKLGIPLLTRDRKIRSALGSRAIW